ncbi:hypothetical protein [Spirillospora sp. CA-128828]|uniref:hypothetical protein n=1 Tax=Spirillospora sp. CA-128828 TaxID=3240033 RepID=UPI003D8AAD18
MHPQYQQRPHRSPGLIIGLAAAVVLVAVVVVVVVAVAYSRSPEWDRATIQACEAAKEYHERDGDAAVAVEAASRSGVAELRVIARKNAPDGSVVEDLRAQTGAIEISTWCIKHKMG